MCLETNATSTKLQKMTNHMEKKSIWRSVGLITAALALPLAIYLIPLAPPQSAPRRTVKKQAAGAIFADSPYQVGDSFDYDVALHATSETTGSMLADYQLTGTWRLQVVRSSPTGVVMQGTLLDPVLLSRPDPQQPALELPASAQAQFKQPLTYRLDRKGAFVAVAENLQAEVQVRSMLRAIAAATQFVLPANKEERQWSLVEQDTTGKYEAGYDRLEARVLSKTKRSYVALSSQSSGAWAGTSAKVQVESSHSTVRLAQQGYIEALDFEERLQAPGTVLGTVYSTTELHMKVRQHDTLSRQEIADLAGSLPEVNQAPDAYTQPAGYSVGADKARVAGRNYSNLVAELVHLPGPADASTRAQRVARRSAFAGLAALLRLDPEHVDKALEQIREGGEGAKVLWDALAAAGTPEAQAALREVIDMDQWSADERLTQMIGLSFVQEPTEDTVDFLERRVDDSEQHMQARLGLGSTASRLRGKEPQRASTIVDSLLQGFEEATRLPDRIEYLKALGNTGHPDALTVVLPELSGSSIVERSTAVSALRFIEGAEVDGHIARVLATDPSWNVRAAAAHAASYRVPSDTLIHALAVGQTREQNPNVRKSVASTLTSLEHKYTGITEQVEAVSATL